MRKDLANILDEHEQWEQEQEDSLIELEEFVEQMEKSLAEHKIF